MKNPLHASRGLPWGNLPRFTRINRLMMGMAGILMALLVHSTGEVRGQTSPGSYEVKLAWDASTCEDVIGYRIHYGTASGSYNASMVVENVTSATVTGLAEGTTYHFAVIAINAAALESDFSNELSFKPGLHTSRIRAAANGGTDLIVHGLIGRKYDIEASEDLNTWTLIGTVTIPEGGWLEFSDPDAPDFARRFYRTRAGP